jgi:hypothetical protein
MISFTVASANGSYNSEKTIDIQLQNPSYDARTGTAMESLTSGTNIYSRYSGSSSDYFQIQSSIRKATFSDTLNLEPFINVAVGPIIQPYDFIEKVSFTAIGTSSTTTMNLSMSLNYGGRKMMHRDFSLSISNNIMARETFSPNYTSSDYFNVSYVETPATAADFKL